MSRRAPPVPRRPSYTSPLPALPEEEHDDSSLSSHSSDKAYADSSSPSIYSQRTTLISRPSESPPLYIARQPRAERVRSLLPAAYTRQTSGLPATFRTPSCLLLDFSPHLFDLSREKDDRLHAPGKPLPRIGRERRIQDDFEAHETFTPDVKRLCNVFCVFAVALTFVLGGLLVPILLDIQKGLTGPAPIYSTPWMPPQPSPIPVRSLIDPDTPLSVYKRSGYNGQPYDLVFSDEFSIDGRTFNDGDDPYWTAVDLHYRSTGNWEYLDPRNAQTRNGSLEILIEKVDPAENHGFSYRSAMLQSWNQMCFTGALIEVSLTLPGNGSSSAFWAAAWTMGNLGRAGYQASTDGVWPYSYNSCDAGALPNQTGANGPSLEDGFSYLPGQKLSACTCAGEDHPGPQNADGTFIGRAASEIDIFESSGAGFSQSFQVAPFDADYRWQQTHTSYNVSEKHYQTELNAWPGNQYQEAVSSDSMTVPGAFTNGSNVPSVYGMEWQPNSSITWTQNNLTTFSINSQALAPNASMQIGQRLISPEPHYLVLNVAISESFSGPIDPNFLDSLLPTMMRVDYVRVWQRRGQSSVSCSPDTMPTADYIARHREAYTNSNLSIWPDTGASFPKNRLVDQC